MKSLVNTANETQTEMTTEFVFKSVTKDTLSRLEKSNLADKIIREGLHAQCFAGKSLLLVDSC